MYSGPRRSIVIGFALLASVGPWARGVDAQQAPAIEVVFPTQIVRGQTNVLHLAIPGREVFQGAEVSPAAGVTVSAVTNAKKPELSQNVAWWDVTIDGKPIARAADANGADGAGDRCHPEPCAGHLAAQGCRCAVDARRGFRRRR